MRRIIVELWGKRVDVRNRKSVDSRPASFSAPKIKTPSTSSEIPPAPVSSKKPTILSRQRKIILIFAAITVMAAVQLTVFFASRSTTEPSNEPSYKAILPEGKSISSLGGWQRVSPPDKEPVYAYNDTIRRTNISISQQPLPESFKGSVANKMGELAKSYNATNKLQVGDTVVYLGISSKGPQSVIFTKEGLLVLVKAEKKVADADWSAYISSLSSTNLDNLPKY